MLEGSGVGDMEIDDLGKEKGCVGKGWVEGWELGGEGKG